MNTRTIRHLCGILCLSGAWALPGYAKDYDQTKTIEWSDADLFDPLFGDLPTKGHWEIREHVSGKDKDSKDDVEFKDKGEWELGKGMKSGVAEKSIKTEKSHPDAKAHTKITADKLAVNPKKPGIGVVKAQIQIDGGTTLVAPSKIHGEQEAVSEALGLVRLDTGVITKSTIKDNLDKKAVVKLLDIDLDLGGRSTEFGGDSRGSFHDPVSLSFLDLDTTLSISETLFHFDGETTFNGTARWGADGISLHAPTDGQSSVNVVLDGLSSWLTDPFLVPSTLRLEGGQFTATGIFEGLPWSVTPDGVSLPGGLLDSIEFPYQVPDGIVDALVDGHSYVKSLTFDLQDGVSDSAPAPVPESGSTMGLMCVGLIATAGASAVSRRRPAHGLAA